jgi:hypothetical protein
MSSDQQMVRLVCPGCDAPLKTPATNAGRKGRCNRCSTRMMIPGQSLPVAERSLAPPVPVSSPVVAPPQPEQAIVPVKIALPNNLGGVETTVTQGTADSMAKVVTGGILVAAGVALAMFFGGRRPSA